jgi:hypothetical protein
MSGLLLAISEINDSCPCLTLAVGILFVSMPNRDRLSAFAWLWEKGLPLLSSQPYSVAV